VPASASNARHEYTLELATSPDDLAYHRASWKSLVEAGVGPNVYMTPEFLEANIRFVQSEPYVVAFLYRDVPARDRHLVAVAAFCRKPPTWKRPFTHLVPLANRYFWDPTPLIHPDSEEEIWDALISQLADPRQPWRTAELVVSDDAELPEPSGLTSVWDAPSLTGLHKPLSREVYNRRRNASSLKSERRRRRQLNKQGNVVVTQETQGTQRMLEEFLALESAGWKGERGTAMLSRDSDTIFLRDMASSMDRKGRLVFITLRLDKELIGASLMLRVGTALHAFKLCYDERLRKYSPGLLTAAASIDYFLASDSLMTMTAGGSPDSWQSRFFLDGLPRKAIHVAQDRTLPKQYARGVWIWRGLRAQLRRRTRA